MTNFISKALKVTALSVTICTLLACQGGGVDSPSNKSVKGKLTFEVSDYITVQSLDVHASQNFGSEVEPLIRARFSAKGKLTEPLYERVGNYMSTDVIRVRSQEGTPINITGKYSATMQGQAWNIDFEDLEAAPSPRGQKLSNWSVGTYVMAGSSEEKALITKDKEATKKREVERKAKELRDIKAAEERKRIALQEKQKTAAMEARLVKEREAARRQAATQLKATEASFRSAVAGTWNPVGSMIDRNNDVYSNGRDKVAISVRFSIPQTQYDKFVVPLTVYASEYPSAQFTTDATVTLDAKSEKISLVFSGNKKVKMACITKPERECSYYESLGKPWVGIVQNGEMKLVGGRNRNITLRRQ